MTRMNVTARRWNMAFIERVLAHESQHIAALFLTGVCFARQRRYQPAVERWERTNSVW